MNDKIEVGEYVRTDYGEIHKVVHIVEDDGDWNYYRYENNMGDFQLSITKHSKQLIDLIEVGDLIIYRLKGLKHQEKGFTRIYKDARSGKANLGIDNYSLEQIEIIKILTHEQIDLNCYKVGGENDN